MRMGDESKTKEGRGGQLSLENSPRDLTNRKEATLRTKGCVSIVLHGLLIKVLLTFSDIK